MVIKNITVDLGKTSKYDMIILGGGIYASGIAGLSFLKKNYSAIKEGRILRTRSEKKVNSRYAWLTIRAFRIFDGAIYACG